MAQNPLAATIAKTGAGIQAQLNVDGSGNLLVASAAGGDAVTIADGANVAQGTTTDAAWSGSGAGTIIAILKAIWATAGSSFKNYAANNAGDQTKLGAGFLTGISVNTAGTTSTVTLYDGTSTGGAVIGDWSTVAQDSLVFDGIHFTTGLFAVLAGGAAANVTITFR